MKKFLDEHFLLNNNTAKRLYHDYAKEMPVIDYHCHLPPAQIAADTKFGNLTQAWLYGDHYKWRAMRTNGVPESYCTGNRSDWEKFEKWAETVPYTLRNPLYHWTHLELQRYFDIHDVLNAASAADIYKNASAQLGTSAYSTRNLLRKMNVALVCTTDDPADTLEYHQQLKQDGFEIPILPAFRPDQSMNVDDPEKYNQYLQRLEEASGIIIATYNDLLDALKNRHDFFASQGCSVSDHGIEEIYAEDFQEKDIHAIFLKVRGGKIPSLQEARQIKSALLLQLAEWDWEKGWVQQYHLGALRNNNSRMMRLLGPDTGWDSIGDFSQARALAKFLDRLDSQDKLARTILYNLNPADNELLATMIGNFNDGSIAGKVQFGSAWWFLDQKDGMIRQLNALSNMGLLSRFVGMLTDSRSFLSYPRHEYFRRIVCELLGQEVENGELPNDIEWIGKVVKDICYYNAQQYFNWKELGVETGVTR
ncbi:glucuronate isomerase [Chitinophaga ginsengisoli]|uniref:Uronate isomerase n=1 Tax=Chitinophaga ginsengisoli TaxID=363837 RepID=A0A2P8FTA2_9BACT|nr:glucuronate isomerase [Chitinophaga ginsengisoli]PSL24954.1 D-glucuronate isomerase [Chitinophaga ginsengisoli]